MYKNRIYISSDTFSAFVSFIQKGLKSDMNFFVYDCQNLIQERLWTFSSTSFIPNVKYGDSLINKHSIPIIITTDQSAVAPEGYFVILFESLQVTSNVCTIFLKTEEEMVKIIDNKKDQWEAFMKVGDKWQKVNV